MTFYRPTSTINTVRRVAHEMVRLEPVGVTSHKTFYLLIGGDNGDNGHSPTALAVITFTVTFTD